jgi:hypothetical protein
MMSKDTSILTLLVRWAKKEKKKHPSSTAGQGQSTPAQLMHNNSTGSS